MLAGLLPLLHAQGERCGVEAVVCRQHLVVGGRGTCACAARCPYHLPPTTQGYECDTGMQAVERWHGQHEGGEGLE